MKLAAWARANGVHPQTAYRWFRQGTMPVPARRLPSGTILVEVPGGNSDGTQEQRVVLYARVSAHDQRPTWTGRSPGCRHGQLGRASLSPRWSVRWVPA
jgi:predicted site-specific integrase-resolvase